jgi:hypothetical protein
MGETVTKQDENNTNERLSLTSAVFKRLQWTFLVGYLLAAGNHIKLSKLIFYKNLLF